MTCPSCDGQLVEIERSGVRVDACRNCRDQQQAQCIYTDCDKHRKHEKRKSFLDELLG